MLAAPLNPTLTEDQARVMVQLREIGPATTREIGGAVLAVTPWAVPIKALLDLHALGVVRYQHLSGVALWWTVDEAAL